MNNNVKKRYGCSDSSVENTIKKIDDDYEREADF